MSQLASILRPHTLVPSILPTLPADQEVGGSRPCSAGLHSSSRTTRGCTPSHSGPRRMLTRTRAAAAPPLRLSPPPPPAALVAALAAAYAAVALASEDVAITATAAAATAASAATSTPAAHACACACACTVLDRACTRVALRFFQPPTAPGDLPRRRRLLRVRRLSLRAGAQSPHPCPAISPPLSRLSIAFSHLRLRLRLCAAHFLLASIHGQFGCALPAAWT